MTERPSDYIPLIVPTLQAGKLLPAFLAAIGGQDVRPAQVVVLDSSSTDRTAAIARGAGCDVETIARDVLGSASAFCWRGSSGGSAGTTGFGRASANNRPGKQTFPALSRSQNLPGRQRPGPPAGASAIPGWP